MKTRLLFACLFISLLTTRCLAVDESLLPGSPAPQIKVAKWLKGTAVDAFEPGKVYVVEYWATWCGPCKKAIPHVTSLAKKYEGKVTFIGMDVMEKGDDPLPDVESFVQKMGDQMSYNIAYDGPDKFMQENWLKAAGVHGIPTAFIVNQSGKIAWIGYPTKIEGVLEHVLAGTWDINAAAKEYQLLAVDMDLIPKMNVYMTNKDFAGALAEIDRVVSAEPGLRYYFYAGHYRYFSLCNLDPTQAIAFGKTWVAANDDSPPYDEIVNGALSKDSKDDKELSLFGADAIDQILSRFGDTVDKAYFLEEQSDCYLRAGERAKAISAAELALNDAKAVANYSPEKLQTYSQKLQSLKSPATQPGN